jgi:riboflavin kinase/FMN adenylyltransferase
MEILSPSSKALKDLRRPVVTVGSFDGIHRAHQDILREIERRAERIRGQGLVMTFDPHPRLVVDGGEAPALLTTREEKLDLLRKWRIDYTLLWPFDERTAALPAGRFVEEILHGKIGVHEMVIGHDHAFGHHREGRLQTLRNLGERFHFTVTAIEPVLYENEPVSSTRIRRRLEKGDVGAAADMLGRPYELEGSVVRGEGRGRKLRFPTANLDVPGRKLIPGDGVYAVHWKRDSDLTAGMINIGVRPTFDGTRRTLEIHVFDFQGSLYGENVRIQFIQKIRDERKFISGRSLEDQMKKDEQTARRLLAAG